MKMNILVLAIVSLIMSGNASGASITAAFDSSNTPLFSNSVQFDSYKSFELSAQQNYVARDLNTLETSSSNITAVPVPGAVWLFMSGLMGMISITRRKKPCIK